VDEEPPNSLDRVVFLGLAARFAKSRTQHVEVVDDEPRMRLRRRSELWLDADVELLTAGLEPHTASGTNGLGLRKLGHSEQVAVESPCGLLAVRRRRELHMVETKDRHNEEVYHRPVASQLEDTLVSGFTRLAAETPRRRIDIELRALDILFAGFFGLLLLPVAVVIAALVFVTSGRPVLYRGERVGRHGHIFAMLKFRTLKRDAESRLGPYLGEELVRLTEAEYTRIGRWLKASQLDEIPQLWDVLRGSMSFVGPRPIRARFFAELAGELPAYWQRLVVRPGLTGLAQVRRGYETSMAEKLAHDLEWVADRSVPLYLRTLFGTGVRVVRQTLGRHGR
jgi:lipopolysaccharide/colanic/teichoic acid biosynthesis glycosyltransferase